MLFFGSDRVGKTRVVEAAATVLLSDPHAVVQIDCADFSIHTRLPNLSVRLRDIWDTAKLRRC